jgi:colanic acid/amylovoran biosynthesis glycosyltransferase
LEQLPVSGPEQRLTDADFTCAVVTAYEGLYSETFIRDQIERLPFRVLQVYGTRGSTRFNGRQICSRAANFIASQTVRRIPRWMVKQAENRIDRSLASFWKQNGVRVILTHFADTATTFLESARLAGLPLVVHCHGYDVYDTKLIDRLRAEYTALFRSAAALVVGSSDMREQLITLGAPADRLRYIPVGVDTELFVPIDPSANRPTIVAVGRFVEKKAPYATILAFSQAVRNCPDARMVMAGDGPLLNTCKQMTRALGLADKVEFVGVQESENVRQLMRRARAFAQHSVRALGGDSEGTALTVLEAAASGLPVIATRHGGIKDTMIDGETAFLVDELDIHGMACNMSKVLTNPQLARELGQNARARVVEHYPMKHSIEKLASVLREAVGVRTAVEQSRSMAAQSAI